MSKLENAVPGYTHLAIEPYTPNIGATVHDIDLAHLGDESLRAELRKALFEFQVLFFRKQTLTPEQQIELAKVFGDPDKAKAFFPRHAKHSVIEVLESKPSRASLRHRPVASRHHLLGQSADRHGAVFAGDSAGRRRYAVGQRDGGLVVRNGSDGHTFLVTVSTTESVNPSMFSRLPFDPEKDLQPVALRWPTASSS